MRLQQRAQGELVQAGLCRGRARTHAPGADSDFIQDRPSHLFEGAPFGHVGCGEIHCGQVMVHPLSGRALELKREGNRAVAKRDYSAAERAFRGVIELAPGSVEGYLGLAKTFERTHRHGDVIALLETTKARSSGTLKALADAYRTLANRGDGLAVAPAIKYYEAQRKERPDPVSLYYLGELYREHQKDYGRALEAFKASLKIDPTSPTVFAVATTCAERLGLMNEIE